MCWSHSLFHPKKTKTIRAFRDAGDKVFQQEKPGAGLVATLIVGLDETFSATESF